jgi:subtilisin family serine protease
MKRLAPFAMLVVVIACQTDRSPSDLAAPSFAAAQLDAGQAGGRVPGQYIVVFQETVADPTGLARQLASAHGASLRFTYRSALKGFSARMPDAAATVLARNPNVAYVEQDQEVFAITTETMDGNGDPWGLDRIDAAAGLSGTYNYTNTGSGVTAYIIDTGIRTTHNEFGGRASGGFTAINDGNGTNDCHGHGTHVSGTVGGNTYGVAKSVALVAVRVLNCSGSGTWDQVIAGIDWVTQHHSGPSVANMSLGGGASSAVDQAVQNSIASGVSYAVAAGNGNIAGKAQNACNYSPARVTAAMTVGATTKTDTKASWSNYGSCVDWFAPGVGIKSAWNTSDGATNTISGTSMATPHTTGVAALYLQSNPSATPQQLRDALYAAATKGIVSNSNTPNNDLLYSPPGGFGGSSPPPNNPPTAAFTFSCTDLNCSFTDGSSDSDGAISSWSWTFGDGGTSSLQNPQHSYAAGGTYSVWLTVTDNDQASDNTSHSVSVTAAQPPAATLSASSSKTRGNWTVDLRWSGFDVSVTSVDVYRNGSKIATGTANTGEYSDSGKGGGSLTYQVCAAGTSSCSNTVTVSP